MRRLLTLSITAGLTWTLAACGGNAPPDVCSGFSAGDLVITELMTDPAGSDTGKEYVEIYNRTDAAIPLKGITLYAAKADGTEEKGHVIRAGAIPANGYFTMGDVREGALPEYIDYTYETAVGALGNETGRVGVRCGAQALDEVTYAGAVNSGYARTFTSVRSPDAAANDDQGLWCEGSKSFAEGMFGSPRRANDACSTGVASECLDGTSTRPTVKPSPGQLFFTEVMANPAVVSDDDGEWLEVYASADVDLNGVDLLANTTNRRFSSPNCLRIRAGTFAVIARSADPAVNGGLTSVLTTSTVGLSNSGATLTLQAGDVVIDTATYGPASDGVAQQLDAAKSSPQLNDDVSSFCAATTGFGAHGNLGTPGAANVACPIVPGPNQCVDPVSGQPRDIVRPVVGGLVISEWSPNPAAVDDSKGEFLEVYAAADVDLNGLEVANDGTSASKINGSTCLRASAGSYRVFAKNTDALTNGGLPQGTLLASALSLGNSGDRKIELRFNGQVVDAVNYGASVSGASTQVDVNKLDPALNDALGNVCTTPVQSVYGAGDRGTPGAANLPCP